MSSSISSSDDELPLISHSDQERDSNSSQLQGRGIRIRKNLTRTQRIIGTLSLILFVATIAFLGLALAGKVHGLLPIYTLTASVAVFCLVFPLDLAISRVETQHMLPKLPQKSN